MSTVADLSLDRQRRILRLAPVTSFSNAAVALLYRQGLRGYYRQRHILLLLGDGLRHLPFEGRDGGSHESDPAARYAW